MENNNMNVMNRVDVKHQTEQELDRKTLWMFG